MKPRILGVIPARGGSKGVPGKNVKPLGGVPLIGHTVLLARASGLLDRLWVSTDDPAIAAAAERFGAPTPWLRPSELGQDGSSMVDVLAHLLDRLKKEEGYVPDAVMILQPTSPFRTVETMKRAVEMFTRGGGKTVISVAESRAHPYWSYRMDKEGRLQPFIEGLGKPAPRQQLPAAYVLDGSMHLIETGLFLRAKSFYNEGDLALPVPHEEAVDIDTPFDWETAEALWDLRHPPAAATGRVYVIAEAGVNHDGKLDDALRLVEAAKAAGADAVKFQTFRAERLVARGAAKAAYQERTAPGAKDQKDLLAPLELDEKSHVVLRDRSRALGIDFLSTPFDEASADMLDRVGVPLFKLSSGDLTNKPLLEHVASKGKPVILSTGMSTLDEVAAAVGWVRARSTAPVSVLHCVTEYPAPAGEVNLRAMDALRRALRLPVGYSDHTLGAEVALAAVARGAEVIEKHITLDKKRPGPDHAASLEPAEFAALVRSIRAVAASLGNGVKRPAPCEEGNRLVARRSLVSTRALSAGDVLIRTDLDFKRPGHGIPPASAEAVVGRRLKRAVAADTVLTWEDLQ